MREWVDAQVGGFRGAQLLLVHACKTFKCKLQWATARHLGNLNFFHSLSLSSSFVIWVTFTHIHTRNGMQTNVNFGSIWLELFEDVFWVQRNRIFWSICLMALFIQQQWGKAHILTRTECAVTRNVKHEAKMTICAYVCQINRIYSFELEPQNL